MASFQLHKIALERFSSLFIEKPKGFFYRFCYVCLLFPDIRYEARGFDFILPQIYRKQSLTHKSEDSLVIGIIVRDMASLLHFK